MVFVPCRIAIKSRITLYLNKMMGFLAFLKSYQHYMDNCDVVDVA